MDIRLNMFKGERKLKKKLLALIMSAVMIIPTVAFTGCGSKNGADVVVIGAGGAGLAAAVEAHDAGKSVVVLEKMPMVGGNTNRATGGLNAAGTAQQEKAGIKDSSETMYNDTMKGGYNKNNPDLVKLLSEQAKDSVAWLTKLGGDLNDVGMLAGASQKRAHRPTGGGAVGAEIVSTLKKSCRR